MARTGPHARAARRLSLPADLFQVPEVLEASTSAFDPDKLGVGSSPYTGDAGNSWLFVPQTATASNARYLFRLCGFAVPPNGKARLIGIRQYLTIAQETTVRLPEVDEWVYVNERPVVTPGWSFSDGNVSWHVRVQTGPQTEITNFPSGVTPQPGWSMNLYSTDSSIVLRRPPALAPANNGVPPGQPIGSLGTFRDLRFPWIGNAHSDAFGYEVVGPAMITFWASVKQTDPATRPYLPQASAPDDISSLTPEEQFLLAFGDPPNNAVMYRHIGGALVANVGPIDMPWSEIDEQCADRAPLSLVQTGPGAASP